MADPEKKRRGCLYYGCLTVFLMGLVVVLILGGVTWWAARKALAFTEGAPLPLSEPTLSAQAVAELNQRTQAFFSALEAGEPVEDLALTQDELNALLDETEAVGNFPGKIHVDLHENQATVSVAAPLENLPLGFGKERYLNVVMDIHVQMRNGILVITPENISVGGKPMPGLYLEDLKKKNLATWFYGNTDTTAIMEKIQDILVQDGKLTFVPRTRDNTPPPPKGLPLEGSLAV